ncbi:MAG: hypothetical protein KC421_23620, partial [Anaerolineales bacterium]|nr:hypothetical protein [Anaerolineales bacterium]
MKRTNCLFAVVLLGLLIVLPGCLFSSPDAPTVTPIFLEPASLATPGVRGDTLPPTPLPPLPTAANTAVPQPTPTYDPGLADWTVMIYLDADNNLEAAGLLDLNEME